MSEAPVVIELRVRELSQMFDSRDPSPFREQDLAPSVEEYIVESVKELHGKVPSELILYLDPAGAKGDDERILANAVRTHFARRALHLRLNLRELMRQGTISLGIGLTFLVVFFVAGQAVIRVLGENPWST